LVRIQDASAEGVLSQHVYAVGIDGVPRVASFARAAEVSTRIVRVDRAGRVVAENAGVANAPSAVSPTASWDELDATAAAYVRGGERWRAYQLDGRANWLGVETADGSVTTDRGPADEYTRFGDLAPRFDVAGNVEDDGDATYAYNAFDELVSVERDEAVAFFTRDAFGRIVAETDGMTGETALYGYAGAARAIRRADDGSVSVVVDAGLDQHLLELVRGPGGERDRRYVHQDRLGSVYLLSSSAGTPLEWYEYSAFGERTILGPDGDPRADSALAARFGFQGHPHDRRLGLVDMRARHYKPTWGRVEVRLG
jgi:YD repeat-containing protein